MEQRGGGAQHWGLTPLLRLAAAEEAAPAAGVGLADRLSQRADVDAGRALRRGVGGRDEPLHPCALGGVDVDEGAAGDRAAILALA